MTKVIARKGPMLTEEEKRQRALAMFGELEARYGVTRGNGSDGAGVTSASGPVRTAAEWREGPEDAGPAGAEGPILAPKIADSPAAARAPQAGGRWPTGPQSNGRATGSSAPEAAAPEKEQPAVEKPKTKPNRKENEFMLNLMILRNTLRQNAPACRDRARLAGKWIWRDIRLMLCLVDRIQGAMLETMPASRDEYYAAYARHGHYELHIDGPVRTARHLLVTDRHLAAMAEAAMKSECILCMREGAEISRCELREALLEAAAPSDYQGEGRMVRKCEYREAAGQLVQGKDVTV